MVSELVDMETTLNQTIRDESQTQRLLNGIDERGVRIQRSRECDTRTRRTQRVKELRSDAQH